MGMTSLMPTQFLEFSSAYGGIGIVKEVWPLLNRNKLL